MAQGLLRRVREGRTLFYGTDDILAAADFRLEEDALSQLVLAGSARHDDRAEAAASVLGPEATGRVIDQLLELSPHLRSEGGKADQATFDRYHELEARLAHVPGSSLIAAIEARATAADNEQLSSFAKWISRHPRDNADRGRPFDETSVRTISQFVEEWSERLLVSTETTRHQLASVAGLAKRAPDARLLPALKRLLDENLRCYRAFREEAYATKWRPSEAVNQARWPMIDQYYQSFLAIKDPETSA